MKHNGNTRVWFAGNGLPPTTKLVVLIQLPCVVLWRKMQCSKLKIHNRIYTNVSFFILRPTHPTASRISMNALWIYGNLNVFNNYFTLLASRKICDWLPDNNLSAETIWHKVVTQGVGSCRILYSIEDLLHLYNSCLLKLRKAWA